MNEDKRDRSFKGKMLSTILSSVGLGESSRSSRALASSAFSNAGSVSVAGNNQGSIVNINADSLALIQQVNRELPSFLSAVVVRFSSDLSEYNAGPPRAFPPEVADKLAYNDFPPRHPVIQDYLRYAGLLDATYRGVEQRNGDARRLVRRRAGAVYSRHLNALCSRERASRNEQHDLARRHAVQLFESVADHLLSELSPGSTPNVMLETAHLAVCLVVADAVIECEVLERPDDVASS